MDEPFYLDLAVQRVWAGPKIGEQLIRRAADADTVAAQLLVHPSAPQVHPDACHTSWMFDSRASDVS